jgi:HPr kinase/phosphorylase
MRFGANRPLVLGKVEMAILEAMSAGRKRGLFRELAMLDLPCVILEASLPAPEELLSFSQTQSVPLLCTRLSGVRLTRGLSETLRTLLGSGIHAQGVLLRIFEVGVLVMGKSGIGKSECALDLVSRGHALVADDLVELGLDPFGRVIGRSPELIRHHMEVRGLGIINIQELFGPDAVAEENPIDLVVELLEWEQFRSMERTGLSRRKYTILETDLPLMRIPVSLNRNIAIILEVAVRNHLLREKGICTLDDLNRRIQAQLRTGASR